MATAEIVNKELFKDILMLLDEQWSDEELVSLTKKYNLNEKASITSIEQIILKLIKHNKEFSIKTR